jgi:hypothetical protein
MDLKEVLETLISGFQKQRIEFVLSSGLALSIMEYFKISDKEDLLDGWIDEIIK